MCGAPSLFHSAHDLQNLLLLGFQMVLVLLSASSASLAASPALPRPLRRSPHLHYYLIMMQGVEPTGTALGHRRRRVAGGGHFSTTWVGARSCLQGAEAPRWSTMQGTTCRLDDGLREALKELGPVRHIVTPNTEHQKFAPSWFIEYPEAATYACPGLMEKKPEAGWQCSLETMLDPGSVTAAAPPAVWGGAIDLCFIEDRVPLTGAFGSIPFFNEIVFCHRPSKTLICTDLYWNYPSGPSVPTSSRLWKFGMDKIYRPVYNNLMRTSTWSASYRTIMGWEWDYIAPCHGEPVADGAKAVLRAHLAEDQDE